MARAVVLSLLILIVAHSVISQRLPAQVKGYLDRNFRGRKLAGECYEKASENKRVLVGDFDGNRNKDYAVKFAQGKRGFVMVFLSMGNKYRPFYLHIYSADEAKYSDLILFKKGEAYEPAGTPTFKYDSPAEFGCESDVGGVHTYRKGKFIAY